tara:strand:- start:85244 stop:86410 length:1167 start_codon:yes stop_codon:yes gene_type:complete
MQAIISDIIYTGSGILKNYAIIIDNNGLIHSILPQKNIIPEIYKKIFHEYILAPGFIDLQVNGSAGMMFSDKPDLETIERMASVQQSHGVTGILPTVISGPTENMKLAVEAIDKAIGNIPGILGIHYEGPFLNPNKAGIHDVKWIRNNDKSIVPFIYPSRHGRTLVTLAPECVSSSDIKELKSSGIIISAGHTSAGPDIIDEASRNGLTGITHLFNAMDQLGSRQPGTVGAALTNDNLWCGLIGDGFHVDTRSISLALKAKPNGKLFLVSDAMAPVGLASMKSFQTCGKKIHVKDNRCLTDKGGLAGSLSTLDKALLFCIKELGIPIDEALRMVSTYPARAINEGERRGMIEPDYIADLVSLNRELKPTKTWINGRLINKSPSQNSSE